MRLVLQWLMYWSMVTDLMFRVLRRCIANVRNVRLTLSGDTFASDAALIPVVLPNSIKAF